MTYPKLPGLTWDGTLYQNDEMGTVEALLPTGGYPTAHAPAMVELPDGSLLCCWFAGSYEGSADIHIICSLLPKDAPARKAATAAAPGGPIRRCSPRRALSAASPSRC